MRGGENLSPQAIEDVLARHPAVTSCCVVGGPHPDLGEVPVAFVVLRDGRAADAGELTTLVERRLSRTHAPSAIHVIEALPVNAVGKVDRKALRTRTA